jgi:regulator of protease activity HflC (stomatin/prohibitin superfamily)
MMRTKTIHEGFAGLLYEDGAFKSQLGPGKHQLTRGWFDRVQRAIILVDLRQRSLTIKGQEILTADKVAIRVSLLVYFRVTDPIAAVHNVASYEDRIYEDVQLAARRFLASHTLEATLTDRNEISDAVRNDVLDVAAGYGVEILRADVKDLAFPGNLREIMNRVLEVERTAEAQVIEARKKGEALRVQAEAKAAADKLALMAQKEAVRLTAEADAERQRLVLESRLEQAKALKKHPELMKLTELETLQAMAAAGAEFTIGLPVKDLGAAVRRGK